LRHSEQENGTRPREQEPDQVGGAVYRLSNAHASI
jgi:hypothetical protein